MGLCISCWDQGETTPSVKKSIFKKDSVPRENCDRCNLLNLDPRVVMVEEEISFTKQ